MFVSRWLIASRGNVLRFAMQTTYLFPDLSKTELRARGVDPFGHFKDFYMNRKKTDTARLIVKPVRFSKKDLEIISAKIVKHNQKYPDQKINFSKYVRDNALSGAVRMKQKTAVFDKETITELKRIGKNINQIAKRLNGIDEKDMNGLTLERVLREVQSLRGGLSKVMIKVRS